MLGQRFEFLLASRLKTLGAICDGIACHADAVILYHKGYQ